MKVLDVYIIDYEYDLQVRFLFRVENFCFRNNFKGFDLFFSVVREKRKLEFN